MRYLVLPMMPAAAAGCDAEALAQWVTRDSMIGTGSPKAPQI
jgi:nitrile hydratase